MNVTLNQLKAFRSIVRLGSFHGAAIELRLSQPSVSQRIKELESELGTALFIRRGPQISLTAEGHALVDYADRVLAATGEMVERFRSRDPLKGRLRFGLSENFALICLPELFRRLEQRNPGITTSVFVGDSGTLSRLLNERELDIAIVSEPQVDAHVRREPVGSSRLGWFASADFEPTRPVMSPADLAREHLMMMPSTSRLHATVTKWFADGKALPSRVSICNNVVVTRQAIVQGTAIGILPARIMEQEVTAGLAKQLAVAPEMSAHRAAICYQASESGPGLSAFAGLTRELIDHYRIFV
jgi:DNA-binding transcriptional LysR family regulator